MAPTTDPESTARHSVLVIGGINLDLQGRVGGPLRMRESNPGMVTMAGGGVACNIAAALARLGVEARLLSAVGDDASGAMALSAARDAGIDVDAVVVRREAHTGSYLCLLDRDGEMVAAVSDMSVMDTLTPQNLQATLEQNTELEESSTVVVVDTNLSRDSLSFLARRFSVLPLFVDLVSAAKAPRIVPALETVDTIKGNAAEIGEILGMAVGNPDEAARAVRALLARGPQRVFLTMGGQGIVYGSGDGQIRFLGVPREELARNVTGAGDVFFAAAITALLRGRTLDRAALEGVAAAVLALRADAAVPADLDPSHLQSIIEEKAPWQTRTLI